MRKQLCVHIQSPFCCSTCFRALHFTSRTQQLMRTCGARMVPARARPEPFCACGLRPPPRTSRRVFALCVPCSVAGQSHDVRWVQIYRECRPKVCMLDASMATLERLMVQG